MMHRAWCSTETVPYCFSRSFIKFQGHTGWLIDDLNQIWVRLLGRSQLSNPSDLSFYYPILVISRMYGSPSASDVTLDDLGCCGHYQSTTKCQEAPTIFIILDSWDILWIVCQCNGCWCSGSLHHPVISVHVFHNENFPLYLCLLGEPIISSMSQNFVGTPFINKD